MSFLDDIITYIDGKFNGETTLAQKPIGHYAYEYNLVPSTTPYYTAQLVNIGDERDSLEKTDTETVVLQINLYGVKTVISSVVVNAQKCAMKLGELCDGYMQEYKFSENTGILSMQKTTHTPPIPYNDGSKSYTVSLRYRIEKTK